jgi:flagellar biosynthesis/type III secretory pathway M-ring protein FliF/YscJ
MRTDTSSSPAPVFARLRAGLGRARRRFAAQPAGFRWSLALAAVAALAALAYAANGPVNPEAGYVRSGETFSSDDLIDVRRALDAEHIAYVVDGRRVRVEADRLDAANAALAKLNPGPPSLREIERQARQTSFFDTLQDRLGRKEWAESATLAAMIRGVGDFVDARVLVHHPRPRGFARSQAAATAFVYVEHRDTAGSTRSPSRMSAG